MDWSAMSEHGRVEAKRGDLALAASSFLDILKSSTIFFKPTFVFTFPSRGIT
jgi:hypothetical protein